jgi:hypothetical protein
MGKVNKAAKAMIDDYAEDDGADDDDMQHYGDKNLDEYDYDDEFLRNDQSELTEYASDEESNDEDSDESDECESGADDESGGKSDEEIESEEQEERPDEEELLKLPLHPLHVSNKGGERKKQDETIRTFATHVLDGLLRVGNKMKDYRSSQKTKKKGSRPSKTAMKSTVDRWSAGPDEYQLTAKMRKARQEWSDLNPEQRAWSNAKN